MCRQVEMWKQWLSTRVARCIASDYFRQLAKDAVRTQRAEEIELAAARRFRAMVGQVYDLALPWTFNRGMRLVDETFQTLGEPVAAAGLLELTVHALLHNDPVAVVGDDEAVQILEPVLHSGTVDLRYQAAGCGERCSIKAYAVPISISSCGVCREYFLRPPQTWIPISYSNGASPRFNAPMTLVVIPEECQSMPIMAPNDWNQNG
jgi:hypothetical protein